MTVVELKAQVLALVEQEDDPSKLEEVKALLTQEEGSDWEREEMMRRAKESEADFEAGRVLTRDQVEARIRQRLQGA
ncbi:MAG TPA: hypothetical protein DCR93_01720 [Cytophagales bacterium]|nr:hypothetical protein [Cytophagales bacterium]HAP58270.1 hypothetical protein [Cytophagales bacterium]